MDNALYENQFDSKYHFEHRPQIDKTLVIASTPRCGSHLLGHSLYETRQFGFPLEYVQPENLNKWKSIFRTADTSSTLDQIERNRTSPNGVFSLKVHYHQLGQLGGFDGLLKRYKNPYIVLLSRSDELNQAVSLSIARQSGVWISGQVPKNTNLIYNFEDINYCLRRTILHNASWRYLLASSTCNYIELDFAMVKTNLNESVKTISNFMEIKNFSIEEQVVHATKRQSSQINKDWISRFKEEKRAKDVLIDVDELLEAKSLKSKIKYKIKNMFLA